MTTLIALDIDYVLNISDVDSSGVATIDGMRIRWRHAIAMRLRALEVRDDVRLGWLTTWLFHDAALTEFEEALGLDDARWLRPPLELGAQEMVRDAGSPAWFKRFGFTELIQISGADRAVWIDDDLPPDTEAAYERWEFGVSSDKGLTHDRFDRLEEWLARTS